MAKYALLIGVSNYEGLSNLLGTQKDIEEMQRVLQDPNIGNFDENDLRNIIFIVNAIDRCNHPGDADRVIAYFRKRIKEFVSQWAEQQWGKKSTEYKAYLQKFGEPKIFGVSAYQALEAKINNHHDLLVKSRFTEFESALEKLIITQKETKCLQKYINTIITSAIKVIKTIDTQNEPLKINQLTLEKIRAETESILENARNIYKKVN